MTAGWLAAVIIWWLTIGLVTAWVVGRRSRRFSAWVQLGFFLGPLLIPLAVSHVRRVHRRKPEVVRRAPVQEGVVDVLVGIDGSREALAALQTIVEILGQRLRRLLIARAVMYDSVIGEPDLGHFERDLAVLDLNQAAVFVDRPVEAVVLAGDPARALADCSRESEVDLIAVGSRGRGLAAEFTGSVGAALTKRTSLPLFVVSSHTAAIRDR
jgi:nucleotide-binding universal stress UspA family protein